MRSLLLLVCSLLLMAGCNEEKGQTGLPKGDLVIQASDNKPRTITVEIAATPQTREIGMMYRDNAPQGTGMLFVFPQVGEQAFWMRNTLIPLDLLFIDDNGIITHIHEGAVPEDESMIPSHGPVRYVLEVAAGEVLRLGLKTGDRITTIPLAQ